MVRVLLFIGLLAATVSALADSFEFAGLSRATTVQDVAKRYPNSTVSGYYVYVSPKDTHDHIYGIALSGPTSNNRLRISFESPDRKYPPCKDVERTIVLKYGAPASVREFREEAAQNRYLVWKLELETIQLQCFRFGKNAGYSAEAIAAHPTESRKAPSNAGAQRTPVSGLP